MHGDTLIVSCYHEHTPEAAFRWQFTRLHSTLLRASVFGLQMLELPGVTVHRTITGEILTTTDSKPAATHLTPIRVFRHCSTADSCHTRYVRS